MDVRLFASSNDFLFGDLFSGNVSTERDVESNGSCVEGRFLRDEGDGATVRLNVQVGDLLANLVRIDVGSGPPVLEVTLTLNSDRLGNSN